MKKLGWIAVGSGLALWAAGCARPPPPSFQGYVEGEFVHVSSPEAGRLTKLCVARGADVPAGAPLFELESDLEVAAEAQAREQLAAAEAQLRDLREGRRPPEIEVIRAQLAQARAVQNDAAATLERDEAQHRTGGISTAQYDRSRASAEAASARAKELENQLQVAALPAREGQIRAQTALVAAARAVLAQAEWRRAQTAIRSPVAGRVSDTLFREGEWVSAGRPVVRLLPPENVKIRFFVPETELGALPVGAALALRCDGNPTNIPIAVNYVAEEAEYTPPVIYSNETRSKLVFMVEARPAAGAGAGLHPGQPVQVLRP